MLLYVLKYHEKRVNNLFNTSHADHLTSDHIKYLVPYLLVGAVDVVLLNEPPAGLCRRDGSVSNVFAELPHDKLM